MKERERGRRREKEENAVETRFQRHKESLQHLRVGWFSRKLVLLLSVLIIQQDNPLHSAHCQFAVVRRPGQSSHLGCSILRRQVEVEFFQHVHVVRLGA